MEKRGSYFFVLDVFIASAVLVLTLIIIFSSRLNVPPADQSFRLAEDYMNFLSTTEFRDISNPFKLNLTKGGFVNDTSMNLLQVIALTQIIEARNMTAIPPTPYTAPLIESLTQGIIPAKYGIRYTINGTMAYERNSFTYASAQIILSSHRLTFIKNNGIVYGPFITEVQIWT